MYGSYTYPNKYEHEAQAQWGGLDCTSLLCLPEHRSGWNHVTDLLRRHFHHSQGPLLVDFVEKLWGWNSVAVSDSEAEGSQKHVHFCDEDYWVERRDVKGFGTTQHVYLPALGVAVTWDEGSWQWVLSDRTADEVRKASEFGVLTIPWVGIVHNPTNMPKWFDYENSPQELVRRSKFLRSLRWCKGLVVFSEQLRRDLQILLPADLCVRVFVVTHPTEPVSPKSRQVCEYGTKHGNWLTRALRAGEACIRRPRPRPIRLVQLGYWLRRMVSIWTVPVPDHVCKFWMNRAVHGFECFRKEFETLRAQEVREVLASEHVRVVETTDDEFDEFLRKPRTVVFLHLYDSSCNNAIIEAIVRHVPVICNRLPAVTEYLGKDYCLLYDDLSEVAGFLSEEWRLEKAHRQTKALERSGRFYARQFIGDLREVVRDLRH